MNVVSINRILFNVFLCFMPLSAQLLMVSDVKIDSIWNSDSSWYDYNNNLLTRIGRDCIVSFTVNGTGTVACSLSVSLDSGKTWDKPPNPLRIMDTSYGSFFPEQVSKPFTPGTVHRYHIRLLISDCNGIIIRVYCRQYAPTIKFIPNKIIITGSIDSLCHIPLQIQEITDNYIAYGKPAQVLWDTIGNTSNSFRTASMIFDWETRIPDYTRTNGIFSRTVYAAVKDNNGTTGPRDSVVIKFAAYEALDSGIIIVGSYDSQLPSSMDLDSGITKSTIEATKSGSGIDLVGTYSGSFKAYRIFNPEYAKNISNITIFEKWQDPARTSFCRVFGIDFHTIKLRSQIAELYSYPDTLFVSSADKGDMFVIKTDQNKFALIQIVSFDTTASGTGTIRYIK